MTHPHMITKSKEAREFILGGNARFTLKAVATGKRFTYKVQVSDIGHMYFVRVLTNGDNDGEYSYAGFFAEGGQKVIKGQKGLPSLEAARLALSWTMVQIHGRDEVPATIEFWHEGRCARCARPLTDPESIARGFGPECIKHVG